MPEGVFQTDRAIFDNPIWKNTAKFRLFFFIYGNAVFAENGVDVEEIHVAKGQYLRSYRSLAKDLEYIENHSVKMYSVSHIKKLVDELVAEERLKIEHARLGTLFTVLNYEKYQGFERFEKANTEQRKNGVRTQRERNENNNNNVNNDNNDKNITYALFERFWSAYPKKRSRGQAEKAWVKLKVDEQLLATMLAKIEQAKKSTDWQKNSGQYIPYPATWLNAKGWEDEASVKTGSGKYDDFQF